MTAYITPNISMFDINSINFHEDSESRDEFSLLLCNLDYSFKPKRKFWRLDSDLRKTALEWRRVMYLSIKKVPHILLDCKVILTLRARFGEPFWNDDNSIDFLSRSFIICSHSGIVYTIPCILLFGAEWAEWKSSQWLFPFVSYFAKLFKFLHRTWGKIPAVGQFQSTFGTIVFSCFIFQLIISILPILIPEETKKASP